MKYTISQRERDIGDAIARTSSLRESKGHDYAGLDNDCLANYRPGGWVYCILRVMEKCHRVKTMNVIGCSVANESIKNELDDIINIALFARIMYDQETSHE